MNKLYTTTEIAQTAKAKGRPVTTGYLRRLCRNGEIRGAYKIAGSWVVPFDQGEKWLAEWLRPR